MNERNTQLDELKAINKEQIQNSIVQVEKNYADDRNFMSIEMVSIL